MMEMQVAGDAPDPRFRYRMKDLCELTGLGRQAIHFYIQRGILPPGHKTGRNMAYYGEEHLERLRLIKQLQQERFLPLKAIAAILDDRESAFPEGQRGFLLGVKQRLGNRLGASPGEVEVAPLLVRLAISREDFDRMVELELIGCRYGTNGTEVIASDAVWLLEAYAEAQRLGFIKELGFGVDDLVMYEEIAQQMFQREALTLAARIPRMAPEQAAEMIERVLPLVHTLIDGMHRAKIRNFLASLG
jgi:DNA-binding transcriptional MerR regulator